MSEGEVVAAVLVAVTALPRAMFWRNNTGALPDQTGRWVSFGVPGSPDVLGCFDGRAVAIECKAPKGRLRKSQRWFRTAWERAGGAYLVARSAEEALIGLQSL